MTPEETRCVMTQIVMPMHTNGVAGVMFGGIMMQWIDVCAGVAAMRHAHGGVLTASIDRLDFLSPVKVGEIVVLQAQVNYTAQDLDGGRLPRRDRGHAQRDPPLRHEGVPDVRRGRRARPAAGDRAAARSSSDEDIASPCDAERRRNERLKAAGRQS